MPRKSTKLEKLQEYYRKNGFHLEQSSMKVRGKTRYSYRLIAVHPLGAIKRGEVVTSAKTMGPFERMRQDRFLERKVPKSVRREKLPSRRAPRITPKTPRLRR